MVVAEKTAANSPHYTCSADSDILNHRVQGNRKIFKQVKIAFNMILMQWIFKTKLFKNLIKNFYVEFIILFSQNNSFRARSLKKNLRSCSTFTYMNFWLAWSCPWCKLQVQLLLLSPLTAEPTECVTLNISSRPQSVSLTPHPLPFLNLSNLISRERDRALNHPESPNNEVRN